MMKKSILAIAFLLSASNVFCYEWTFYNATNTAVWVQPFFSRLSIGDERAFQGAGKSIAITRGTYRYDDASRILGPVLLEPKKRYSFNFNAPWNAGLCFDRMFLGADKNDKNNLFKTDVKVATSEQFTEIMNAANKFSTSAKEAAQGVGKAAGQFGVQGKAVQAVAEGSGAAAEALVGGITELIRISRCGNLDFLIATDPNKNLTAVIQK